jgi:hypothetical protein
VTRVLVDDQIQYEFKLVDETTGKEKTYVTTGRPLSDFRAEAVEGRATRVWVAYEKGGDKDKLVVLKDLWMFSDTKPETHIVRDICKDLSQNERKIFLTTLADNWVYIDGQIDQTDALIMRGFPKPAGYLSLLSINRKQQTTPRSTMAGSGRIESYGHTPRGAIPVREESKRKVRLSLSSRRHRRTVFLELCQPLHYVEDLCKVNFILHHATRGWSLLSLPPRQICINQHSRA